MKIEKKNTSVNTVFNIQGKKQRQTASVIFIDGEFKECRYHTENIAYTYDDWIWIGELSEFIKSQSPKEKEKVKRSGLLDENKQRP